MIPTMIVFGLVFGRWWRTCLVVGTAAWPLALLADGVIERQDIVAAAVLALANTALGVALHQAGSALCRAGARWLGLLHQ